MNITQRKVTDHFNTGARSSLRSGYFPAAILLTTFSVSQVVFSQTDTLSAYEVLAMKNNPSVLVKFNEYEAALRKVPQAGSLPDPQLDLGVFLTPMELPGGKQVADIKLMQMFPWFGVLKNARDEMSMMARMRYESFTDEKLQTCYEVRSTWYDLWRIRKELTLYEKSLTLLSSIRELALTSYSHPAVSAVQSEGEVSESSGNPDNKDKGTTGSMQKMGTESGEAAGVGAMNTAREMEPDRMVARASSADLQDIYQLDIEKAELINNIEALHDQERAISVKLNGLLNRAAAAPVFTVTDLQPDTLNMISIYPDSVMTSTPMLRMIRFEKEAYESRLKMAQRMGYPMVGLGLNYSVIRQDVMTESAMNGKDMLMPMVSLTIPMYRKKYLAQREESEFLSRAAAEKYRAAGVGLRNDFTEAVNRFLDERRKLRLYEKQTEIVTASLNIALAAYSSGSQGLSALIRLRQQALEYEVKKAGALSGLNTSTAMLRRITSLEETQF